MVAGMAISLSGLRCPLPRSPSGEQKLGKILIGPDWVVGFSLKHHMTWGKASSDWPALGQVWLLWLGVGPATSGPLGIGFPQERGVLWLVQMRV